jgi:hypothetical protein
MDGFPALGLHGDKNQVERDWVLAEFKAAKHPIMIATDVAARGLGECSCACWGSGLEKDFGTRYLSSLPEVKD